MYVRIIVLYILLCIVDHSAVLARARAARPRRRGGGGAARVARREPHPVVGAARQRALSDARGRAAHSCHRGPPHWCARAPSRAHRQT